MSGVYIPGMEMPSACSNCELAQHFDGHNENECPFNAFSFHDCPLIPVPDHGDLIDVDEFYADINESVLLTDAFKETFNLWFEAQPIIIPADKEEQK